LPEHLVQMQRIFLVFTLLLIICPTAIFTQVTWRAGEMEVQVSLNNRQDADILHHLGLKGEIYSTPGYATLYVTPEELDLIRKEGIQADILIPDMKDYALNFWSTRDQYHSYDEIIEVIDSLSTNYPSICKKFSYGLSVEGRQLCALKISDNVENDENEAEIMFDGGIHGDEVGGAENLVRFSKKLCQQYGTDPDITNLIDSREIWLYIMVNPDGRVNMVRYNSNGVDLNRDWGYMWAGSGSSPFYYSQVETRALRNCILDNQFVIQTIAARSFSPILGATGLIHARTILSFIIWQGFMLPLQAILISPTNRVTPECTPLMAAQKMRDMARWVLLPGLWRSLWTSNLPDRKSSIITISMNHR
jgi:hypothetical protein